MSSEEEDKKRMWIKYYCEECKAWETREAKKLSPSSLSPSQQQASESTLWSWGCVKQIHHGALQTFRVDQLNVDAELEADAVAAPFKLDFPSIESSPATAQQELLEVIDSFLSLHDRFLPSCSFTFQWRTITYRRLLTTRTISYCLYCLSGLSSTLHYFLYGISTKGGSSIQSFFLLEKLSPAAKSLLLSASYCKLSSTLHYFLKGLRFVYSSWYLLK